MGRVLKRDLGADRNDQGDFEGVSCGVCVVNFLPPISKKVSVKSALTLAYQRIKGYSTKQEMVSYDFSLAQGKLKTIH